MSTSKTTTKHYIGIDPSINSTGVAVRSHTEATVQRITLTIQPSEKLTVFSRMLYTQNVVEEFLKTTCPEGEVISACIEGSSYDSSGKHDELGQNRGILKFTLYQLFGIIALQPAPTSLKKFASDYGAATKETMITRANRRGWTITKGDDDAADAAHLADLAHACMHFKEGRLTRKQLEVVSTLGIKFGE
jgi:Holliday junction resolvasome RuvABC endonuclease subunit